MPKTKTLDLAAYQARATATAEDEAYQLEYLIPGIMGEVGELFGHRAKAVWHGYTKGQLKEELVSEYGDIAWMTAVLLHRENVSALDPELVKATQSHPWATKVDPWLSLANRASQLYTMWVEGYDGPRLVDSAVSLWLALEFRSSAITGAAFNDVLQANLDKLADRASRGVLRGNGDHR